MVRKEYNILKICVLSCLIYIFFLTLFVSINIIPLRNFCQVAVSITINNSLICFCSFDLSCPIFTKDNFMENVYIVLSCHIKQCSFF